MVPKLIDFLAYFLDDNSAITTNRGNKLNRNARHVRRGRLNSNALFQQVHINFSNFVCIRLTEHVLNSWIRE
jgi:hypothetical protein